MDIDKSKISDHCRICLETNSILFNLFEDPTTTYKLEQCCGVKVFNISTLPSNICKKCSDILNVAYDFRVLCQRSQEFLTDGDNYLSVIEEHQTTSNENELKPDLAEIDLEDAYGVVSDDAESLQEEHKINVIEEYVEDPVSVNNADNVELEQSDEEKYNSADDISAEDSNSENQKSYEFKTRGPRRVKSPVSLMCNVCGNLYTNKTSFTYHMKMHQKDKKFQCEICTKRFMQTCELRAHMRIHTGEKPYKCSYCERKFRDRSGVTRHERTHTLEKPYGCTVCGAHFSYSATLKKHERVHTGEKPFKCFICEKQFSQAHQLKAHLGTIRHKEMVNIRSKKPELADN